MSREPVVFVAGHRGMVGSAICRALAERGGCRILAAERSRLDLTQQADVRSFFRENAIDQVYLVAAKVGGILANNTYPAEFIYQNLLIEANVIEAAHASGVQRLLFTGSSCIYPRLASQPIDELFNRIAREFSRLSQVLAGVNWQYRSPWFAGVGLRYIDAGTLRLESSPPGLGEIKADYEGLALDVRLGYRF